SSFRLTEILGGKEGSHKGVNVKTDGETGHVEIDVAVNVAYGVNIYEAARQMQHVIKDEVESLTGTMPVEKVNVRVQQLVLHEEEPPQPLGLDRVAPGGGEAAPTGESESGEE
ncbi:MAG TPA: Asp23/Gls24 family envelope stress response protein, partial [Sumerlaeia bacterium]|nr:Asp23/Gls24 family envelope stress response protein [Sumerlaeia bacterium]